MATIGTLAVNVIANTENLSRNMKRARAEVGLFGTAVGKATSMMRGFGVTLTAGFAFRAIHNAIKDLDNLADTADRLGTTVEALSRLEYAGFMSDVSSGRLATALTFMEKNIGNNSAALRRFGLDVQRLKQLDAVEMFIQIADAINKMPTAAERTAAAMAVFGRGGGEMMELISGGRSGIEAAMAGTPFAPTDADIATARQGDMAYKTLAAWGEAFTRMAAIETVEEVESFMSGLEIANLRWKLLDRRMQQALDDFAVPLGMIKRTDTRSFGMFSEDVKRRHAAESRGWRKWATETLRIADMAIPGKFVPGMSGGLGMNFFGPGGAFAQQVSIDPNKFLGDAMKHGRPGMSMAMMSRLSSFIDEQMLAISPRESMPRSRFPESPQGLSALEKGTAAAFSQEKRSQQQSQQLEIEKKQLTEQEQMKDFLKNIDKNLQTFDRSVPSNIA